MPARRRRCHWCNEDISEKRTHAAFCSQRCNNYYARRHGTRAKVCKACSADLSGRHPNAHFCDDECRKAFRRALTESLWLSAEEESVTCQVCTGCQEEKSLAEFGRSTGNSKDGYHRKCQVCRNAQHAGYYERNKEALDAFRDISRAEDRALLAEQGPGYKAVWSVEVRRERNRRWVWDYKKAHPCVGTHEGSCPYNATDPRVLEFDHIGDDKAANVSALVYAPARPERLAAEVAKCAVRCRNCHAVVTWHRAGGYSARYHLAEASVTDDQTPATSDLP
ncbi:hypothetical protein [Geodermatophilus sp. SYSU D00696]